MELKTIDGWHKSGCGDWDTYCKPGELVDEGVADYFLDILPPRTMKKGYFQVGEPHSHAVNPETMQSCGTYATFVRAGGGMWEYKGHCFPNGLTEAERYVKYDGLKDFFQKTYKLMADSETSHLLQGWIQDECAGWRFTVLYAENESGERRV